MLWVYICKCWFKRESGGEPESEDNLKLQWKEWPFNHEWQHLNLFPGVCVPNNLSSFFLVCKHVPVSAIWFHRKSSLRLKQKSWISYLSHVTNSSSRFGPPQQQDVTLATGMSTSRMMSPVTGLKQTTYRLNNKANCMLPCTVYTNYYSLQHFARCTWLTFHPSYIATQSIPSASIVIPSGY